MGTIRITSGIYKNRKLSVPASAHPMGERERTAIFNSLGDKVSGANVLDVFAGSGALGLESLSRGAKTATFIENNKQAQKIIRENIKSLDIPESKTHITTKLPGLEPTGGSEERPLASISARTAQPQRLPAESPHIYDVIFADPPYDNPQISVVESASRLLAPKGTLILSLPKSHKVPTLPNLSVVSEKTYAGAKILTYL